MPLQVNPATLSAAVTVLTGLSSTLAGEESAAAPTTTVIAPAGTDSVSTQQAAIFSAFGTELQAVLAQGQDYASQFETNLGNASDTYQFTEANNAADAALGAADPSATAGGGINFLSYLLGGPETSSAPGLGGAFGLSGNTANIGNIGVGNWASAGSDLIGIAGGGLLDTSGTAAGAGLAADVASSPGLGVTGGMAGMGAMGGMGTMPVASMGSASMVNRLSVPTAWAESAVPVASPFTAVQTAGWTAAAPQAGAGTIIPGMPGMAGAGRNAAGFGAPRYGVKPIVMPKATAI
jgi:PE family/PPE-SVP subfamily C-terminal region